MTTTVETPGHSNKALWAILAVIALYGASFAVGLPQRWTAAATGHALQANMLTQRMPRPNTPTRPLRRRLRSGQSSLSSCSWLPSPTFPLIHFTEHWWESNLNRFIVAGGLGVVALAYYALIHKAPIEVALAGP